MSRNNGWATRFCQTGLALIVAAAPFVSVPAVWQAGANAAWAAENQTKTLTQEAALAKVNQWVQVPEGYTLRNARLLETGDGEAVWIFVWEQGSENDIRAELDAVSGELLRYYQVADRQSPPSGARLVDEKEAEQAARLFLQKVAPQGAEELSQPNQFVRKPAREIDQYHFVFTRMVDQVPFPENGVEVTVDRWGRVVSYSRQWWTGELPAAAPTITPEEAEQKLQQALRPSLAYVNLDRWISVSSYSGMGYRPVYRYGGEDPYALDAVSGEVLTRTGGKAAERAPIQPLGSGTRPSLDPGVRITQDEAQKVADQLAKRLPGSYRSEGSSGAGMSSGPDGVTHRRWDFDYRPQGSASDHRTGFQLSISDRGELVEYVSLPHQEALYGEQPTEKPVTLAKAQEVAVAFLKTMLPDRLGELYLMPLSEPEKERLSEQAKEWGRYEIPFGWLKSGIPLEDERVTVTVDAAAGVVIAYRDHDWEDILARIQAPEKIVDQAVAVETERKQKQFSLTYFLPDAVWDANGEPLPREVRLVYRYIGADGVVDAATGEWLDRYALLQSYLPRDIVGHPQEEALRFAVERNLLAVKDGRAEPDKPLTRGELAFMATRIAHDLPIYDEYRRQLFDDENPEQPYRLEDVSFSHPQYEPIQHAVRMGLLSPSGSRFEPDRPVTRLEVAQVAAKLLGYGELLGKPELFVSPFADVGKAEAPAAALADSFGLVPAARPGQFEPDGTFTRAQAAEMFQQLDALTRQR
ncbi:YcdB/YcdC domain-containing protein [Brevibacillus marinus]|uniref:YcdB/YcdC domain-containing protein n=1 Tax=Brevibacillus marinus TaxID=2496837 RepID=UPI000F83A1EB|nr:YcdB/YcdC domain-containing protein [Brevibacillus marinus]